MQYRRRLRSRILISFLLFGVGLTALFAGITLVMREWLEEELIESTLQREVDKSVEQSLRSRSPDDLLLTFSGIRGDIKGPNRFAEVPFNRRFDTGVYDVEETHGGELHHYKLAVRKTPERWAFLYYDVTEQRRTREVLTGALILAVGGFAALSLVIAFWLSRNVIAPVTDLADRVQRFERESDPLAPHYADDEVGRLAAALDDYAARLTSLVQRDREFNADVSHELRTPLAVIRGATELLLAQEGLPEKTRERIKRIDRAARQSHELTEALLLLSRSERPASESSDVTYVVDQVVDAQRTNLGTKPVEVRIEKDAAPKVAAPASVLAVALSNLIGNAFRYTAEGSVTVRIESERVVVEDTGPGIDPSEAGKLFERGYRGHGAPGKGAGLGLAIVRRLCDLYGWRVTLAPRTPRGAIATLEFTS